MKEIGYMNTYGHVCVRNREQNENRQLIALKEVGLTGKVIFLDKQSVKDFNRPHAKVYIVVLDIPLLDTRRGNDLLGTFLSAKSKIRMQEIYKIKLYENLHFYFVFSEEN